MTPTTTPPDEGPSTPPMVGLSEAASLCGVSLSTMRRRRPSLEENGAVVDPVTGAWQIPIPALVTLGLLDRVTPAPTDADTHHDTPPDTGGETPTDTADGGRDARDDRELNEARQRAAVAEARLAEMERLIASQQHTIDVLSQAMRMIEPPRPQAVVDLRGRDDVEQHQQEATEPGQPVKRRWWRKKQQA